MGLSEVAVTPLPPITRGLLLALVNRFATDPGPGPCVSQALASVEIYDPAVMAWSAGPAMLSARHGHGVGLCPSAVVVFGGSGESGIMNSRPLPPRTRVAVR